GEPRIMRNIVCRREPVPLVGPAKCASDLDRFRDLALGPRFWIAARIGDESAIDNDDAAVSEPRRRKHPIARARDIRPESARSGKDQRFTRIVKARHEFDPAVFVTGTVELAP